MMIWLRNESQFYVPSFYRIGFQGINKIVTRVGKKQFV